MPIRIPSLQTRQPVIPPRNIRLTLAFDGTAYHGWQIQENQPTIQGALSHAIWRITGQRSHPTASGRTDAGTHARRLVVNFRTASSIAVADLGRALNAVLPGDIRVLEAKQVTADFHARRSARSKIYRYQIYLGAVLPPHLAREHFHYPYALDTPLMQRAARLFLGEHDFAGFAAKSGAGSGKAKTLRSTVRRIYRCDLQRRGRRLLFTVEGSGFLHHMVRNMVGTLLEVGRGRISQAQMQDLFRKRDRRAAGFTVPAHGLVLLRVRY